MRSCYLIYSLTALFATTHAFSQVNISQILSEVPSCALGCIDQELSLSPTCTIADPTCICANITMQASLSTCVQGTCTQAELIPLAVANNQLCVGFPIQTRGVDVMNVEISLISITLPIVFLRCWSRWTIAKELWWDDWSIMVSALSLIGILAAAIADDNLGFGRHLWEVQATNETALLKILLVAEVLYILNLTATKCSILCFYLRVFRRPMFRVIVIVVISSIIASAVAFIFAIVFQCNPTAGAWDKSLSPVCINANAVVYSISGISIAQDLIILFLPVPELAGLQMSLRKKVHVLAMFSLGGFACVTSMVRLKFAISFGSSEDPTWDDVTPSLWSIVECCVAMICACVPAVRALLGYWFPSIFETASKHSFDNNNSTIQLESKTNLTSRKAHKYDDIIIMSNTPGPKAGPIASFEELNEVHPPTPPKTPVSPSEYSEWRSPGCESDEVEFLDERPPVRLRDQPGDDAVAIAAPTRSWHAK